jgi:hypothetical protein
VERELKNSKKTKGQMRIIETILAAMLIVSALSFVTFFAVNPRSSAYEVKDLEKMGYSILHDLDQQELLAPLVYNEEWSDLRNVLKITLPIDVYFTAAIYDLSGTKLNNEPIIYGDMQTFSDAKNIASVSYSLIGIPELQNTGNYVANYEPRILVLQLARG